MSLLLRIALLAACAILVLPRTAAANEPEPIHRYADDRLPPPGTKVQTLLTGAAVTAGFYLPALGASYLWSDVRGSRDLRIPVVGPWLQVGQTRLCTAEPETTRCSDGLRIVGALLAGLDGLGQAGGVLIFLDGLLMRTAPGESPGSATSRRMWLRQNSVTAHSRPTRPLSFRRGDFELMAAPSHDQRIDLGLSLFGTF